MNGKESKGCFGGVRGRVMKVWVKHKRVIIMVREAKWENKMAASQGMK